MPIDRVAALLSDPIHFPLRARALREECAHFKDAEGVALVDRALAGQEDARRLVAERLITPIVPASLKGSS